MKYALITPPAGFRFVTEYHLGYHFVLSQYCTDYKYLKFYQRMHEYGHFIMLDNGAAELGASIDISLVIKAAEAVGADEIIMPDVLDDFTGTLSRTSQAVDLVPLKQRAMVPQGKDWLEWEACARIMVGMGCATICVAKRYENLPGGRSHGLEIIKAYSWHHTHNIHLLGCYRNPLKEIAAAYTTLPTIRGVDTGAAIAYAQAGALLNTSAHHSLDWNDPFDTNLTYNNISLYLDAHKESDAYHPQE
jgi:hypothetical protein